MYYETNDCVFVRFVGSLLVVAIWAQASSDLFVRALVCFRFSRPPLWTCGPLPLASLGWLSCVVCIDGVSTFRSFVDRPFGALRWRLVHSFRTAAIAQPSSTIAFDPRVNKYGLRWSTKSRMRSIENQSDLFL